MDFIVSLPPTKRKHDAILVIVDRLTKMAHFIPTRTSVTAKEVAVLFLEHIFKLHGLPRKIISDRDARFTGHFWQALFESLGTEIALSTAFHPQTDGLTERMNRTLKQALRAYVNAAQNNWDELLAPLEFAYNQSTHRSTNQSPFFLNYGRHPHTPASLAVPNHRTRVPAANKFLDAVAAATTRAHDALADALDAAQASAVKAESSQRVEANKRRRFVEFEPNDQVLLSTANLTLPVPTRKFIDKWIGPFSVLRRVGYVSYRLALPASYRIHPVFHVSKLKPYVDPASVSATRVVDRQLPPLIADPADYEVESILKQKVLNNGQIKYLVHWKNTHSSDNTWEAAATVSQLAKHKLRDFRRQRTL